MKCYYQKFELLLAIDILVTMLNNEGKKIGWRSNQVAPRLKWKMRGYICSRWSRQPKDHWNSCKTPKIIKAHAWHQVYSLYDLFYAWCGRRRIKGDSIVLLNSGERSLLTISLICDLLLLKPMPLYTFDEVCYLIAFHAYSSCCVPILIISVLDDSN
jgi:hypothetical protein